MSGVVALYQWEIKTVVPMSPHAMWTALDTRTNKPAVECAPLPPGASVIAGE
jgi:hypothetical protein